MRKYILSRLIQLIPILLGITFLSFALMQTASTDAIDAMYENAGTAVSDKILEERKAELGLDKPFFVQYGNWLLGFVKGDLGTSYVSGKNVFETFVSKLPATILLAFSSVIVTMIISIPFGILAAVKQDGVVDYIIRFLSFIGNSMPGFFLSLLLMYIFSVKLKILPVMGGSGGIKPLILPTVTLAIAMSAKYTRQVRGEILKEYKKDYVIGARARGVKESVILYRNILKVSMVTIITLLSLSLSSLLGGTAIIETIFMWDGVGKLAVDAINMRDYPMIQAYVVWMALIYVLINLISDIFYHYMDPRVRLGLEVE